jgi:hypothetical protein
VEEGKMKKLSMKKLFVMFLVVGIVGVCNATVVMHYNLDATTGKTAYDSVSTHDGNLLNATGTPAFSFDGQSVAGKYGTALSFRGPSALAPGLTGDDYINVGTTGGTSLPSAGGNFTVSTWVKTSNWGQGAVIFNYALNNLQFSLGLNTVLTVPQIQVYSKDMVSGLNTPKQVAVTGIDTNIWHLITVAVTNAVPTIYLDGASTTLAPLTTSWATGLDVSLGRRNASTKKYFTGAIDDFAIFDTALTSGQVLDIYNSSTPIPEPTTIALLGFAGLALVRRKK